MWGGPLDNWMISQNRGPLLGWEQNDSLEESFILSHTPTCFLRRSFARARVLPQSFFRAVASRGERFSKMRGMLAMRRSSRFARGFSQMRAVLWRGDPDPAKMKVET